MSNLNCISVQTATHLERCEFESEDNVDFQAVLGLTTFKPSMILSIDLFLPCANSYNVPCILITPGSDGIDNAKEGEYVRNFLSQSVAVGIVNSFQCRGFSNVLDNQAAVSLPAQVLDLALAISALRCHSKIDHNRIGVFGSSRGALVVSLLLDKRVVDVHLSGIAPTSACGLYPSADLQYEALSCRPVQTPYLYIIAANDNEVSATRAIEWSTNMNIQGANFTSEIWQGTDHVFDAPYPAKHYPQVVSVTSCPETLITADGMFLWNRVEPLKTWQQVVNQLSTCAALGARCGHSTDSRERAILRVLNWFNETL